MEEIRNENEQTVTEPDEEILSRIKSKRRAAKTSIGDIVTMQCIVCVLVGIAFIALNFFATDTAEDVLSLFCEKTSDDGALLPGAESEADA